MFVDYTVWMYKVFCHIQLSHRCGLWSKNQATGCRNWWGCLWDRCVPFPGGLSQSIFVSSTLSSLYRIFPILHEVMRFTIIHDMQHLQCYLRANQIGVSCGLSIACVNWSAFHLVTYFHCPRQHWMEQTKTVTFGMAGNSWFGRPKFSIWICSKIFSSPKKRFSEVLSKFLQLEAGPVVLFLEPLGDSFRFVDLNRSLPQGVAQKTSSWECTTILYGAGHACNLSNICRVTGLSNYSFLENFLCGFLCDTPDCLASVTFWEDLLLAGLAEVQWIGLVVWPVV